MNYRLLSRTLGIICLLLAASMLFSLPWAFPALGWRGHLPQPEQPPEFEFRGFASLLLSSVISALTGVTLLWFGQGSRGDRLFRKEAMAVVGLSWVLATVLGGLPYFFCGCYRVVQEGIFYVQTLCRNRRWIHQMPSFVDSKSWLRFWRSTLLYHIASFILVFIQSI